MIVTRQFSRQLVATFGQPHLLGCCRRQPDVLHFNDGLSVDTQIMTTRHLAAHIQQQGIVAFLRNVDGSLKDVTLTYLLLATFGGSHVDDITGTGSLTLQQRNLVRTGVILRQSVIVPQHTVALAGQQHWQANLRVDLRQATGKATHIAVSVLKLAKTEKALVAWRVESQCGNTR